MALRTRTRSPRRAPDAVPVGDTLLAFEDVSVDRGSRRVLDAVDLTVQAGELVVLVGPNGAGKSTVIGVAAGDLSPSHGDATVAGRSVSGSAPHELARVRAVLPQEVAVAFAFRVEEVVAMGRAPWIGSALAADDDAAVADAVAEVDIAHLVGRPVPALSGGERARVALARVLAQRTQLLVLDEPTAALDVHHQELVLEAVGRRVAAGAGALVALHDLGLAAAHADRIAVLDGGRVVAAGPPAEVLVGDLLSRVYDHPIEVLAHPLTGLPLVAPLRSGPRAAGRPASPTPSPPSSPTHEESQ